MKKPQPFFLQVFPPISLYWPFSSLMSTAPVQCVYGTWTITASHCRVTATPASRWLTPYSSYHHILFPFQPKRGLLFALISNHPQQQGFHFCCFWMMRISFFCPTPHQCTSWRSKPKKTWIPTQKTPPTNSNPPLSTPALGLNTQLLQRLAPSWDRTLGNGKRKIWFSEGSISKQAAETSPFQGLYWDRSHTRQALLCSH